MTSALGALFPSPLLGILMVYELSERPPKDYMECIMVTYSLTHSLLLTHSLTHLRTHSPTLTHSLYTHSLTY